MLSLILSPPRGHHSQTIIIIPYRLQGHTSLSPWLSLYLTYEVWPVTTFQNTFLQHKDSRSLIELQRKFEDQNANGSSYTFATSISYSFILVWFFGFFFSFNKEDFVHDPSLLSQARPGGRR